MKTEMHWVNRSRRSLINPRRWRCLLFMGIVTCLAQVVRAAPEANILNISSRAFCETGDAVIVTEFAVQGTTKKRVALRALGPSLSDFGVPDPLQNPTLTLLNARGRLLDVNDNWMDNPHAGLIVDYGLDPKDDRESVILHTLTPGIYTAVLRGVRGGTGTAIAEVFDLDSPDGTTLLPSLGTRASVLTGDDVLISGIILIGAESTEVLVRALGPSLAGAGISGALADPTLELHDSNGTLIAFNDNWRDGPNVDEIIASGFAPDDDLESALIAVLAPDAYTTIVRGAGGATGIGFVQFYSLDNPGPELDPAPIIKPRR